MSRDGSSILSSDRQARRPSTGAVAGLDAAILPAGPAILRRRGLLTALATAPLAACGFQPLYAPVSTAGGATGDLGRELAAIKVAPMYERNGQVMQRILQRRFEGNYAGTAPRYDLNVNLNFTAEVLAYRVDAVITRVRYLAVSDWTLILRGPPPDRIANGQSRAIDAFNVPENQYYATDSSNYAMQRRLVEAVADQVFIRVATELRKRLEGGTLTPPAPAAPPPAAAS